VGYFSRGGSSGLPKHHANMFNSFYYSYRSYLVSSYKFHHLQVPNGSKNAPFGAMYILEKPGLVGYQDFLETCLMAQWKAIAHM